MSSVPSARDTGDEQIWQRLSLDFLICPPVSKWPRHTKPSAVGLISSQDLIG